MSMQPFKILDGEFCIHRFAPGDAVPGEILNADYFWIGKTSEELSVVCRKETGIKGVVSDDGWSVLKLIGPFDLAATGIVAGISGVLSVRE